MSGISFRLMWTDDLLATPNTPEHGDLDVHTRAVAFALSKHMNADGECRPGIRLLVAESAVTHPTVESRLKRLEEAGRLMVSRREGRTNRYRATMPILVNGRPSGRRVYGRAGEMLDVCDAMRVEWYGSGPPPYEAAHAA